jgi:hypothetical protein
VKKEKMVLAEMLTVLLAGGLVLAGCASTGGGGGADVEVTNEALQGSWLNSFGAGTALDFTGTGFSARCGKAIFTGSYTLSGNKVTMTVTSRSGTGSENFKGDMGTGTVSIKGTTLTVKGFPGGWAFFNVKYQKE